MLFVHVFYVIFQIVLNDDVVVFHDCVVCVWIVYVVVIFLILLDLNVFEVFEKNYLQLMIVVMLMVIILVMSLHLPMILINLYQCVMYLEIEGTMIVHGRNEMYGFVCVFLQNIKEKKGQNGNMN